MLGGDDEQRRLVDALVLKRLNHFAEGLVSLLQPVSENVSRRASAVRVTAGLTIQFADVVSATAICVVLGQFLAYAYRLEVHAKDGRHARSRRSVVPQTVNLVEDCLDLLLIVLDGTNHAGGRIEAADIGDFRRVEVIYASAGWTVYQIVSGVLVCPSGVPASSLYDFEDGVGPQRAVGIQRDAIPVRVQVTWQLAWIDYVQRDVRRVIQVDTLVKHHHVARGSRARRVRGVEDGTVVADVVEQSVADG